MVVPKGRNTVSNRVECCRRVLRTCRTFSRNHYRTQIFSFPLKMQVGSYKYIAWDRYEYNTSDRVGPLKCRRRVIHCAIFSRQRKNGCRSLSELINEPNDGLKKKQKRKS